MRCPHCQVENAPANAFCIGCGHGLTRRCARCSHDNPPDARFCSQCSAPLDYGSSHLGSRSATEGERRLVTVLFADLTGSTALIEGLDPEDAIGRLQPAIAAMREAVHRFEGSVIKVQGDGIMALFGAPTPQEDHAVRACCAALAIQVAVHALGDAQLAARVGLHSGEVLARNISNDLSTDYDAVGVTVHIASRMEQMAERGTVLMSAATWAAAQNFIEAAPLGAQPVKGLSAPLAVYRLTGLRRGPASQRFRGERGLSHFTGRQVELAVLQRALDDASSGESRVIGVVGEAGVGKSRLCFEFAESCRQAGIRVLEARALSHAASTPFEPVIDLLRDYFRIMAEDDGARAREKVALRLRAREAGAGDDAALMVDFLGLRDPANGAPPVDPMSRRDRLIEIVRRLVRAGTSEAATVILIEDLHWLDAGSADFLEAVIDAVVGTKALLVVNFRPGYTAPWMARSYYEQLPLRPLRGAAMNEFIGSLLGHDDSVGELARHVAERAGGNPFFIEEQVRALAETGYLGGEPGRYRLLNAPERDVIPTTVQAVIGARIDKRPEPERTVLQAAAVIGREFMVDLLERIVEMPAQAIRQALQRLAAAELVYEQGPAATGAYAFKHPLTQEVAYRAQLVDRRRIVHARIAADLEKTLPDAAGAHAGFVAYHWEEAGNAIQAAQWNVKAAMWHGTRDPAQAFDSWKRVYRLIRSGPVEGPAKYMLMMAAGQLINFAWRIGVTAEQAQPWFDEAVAIARQTGDNRAMTLLTAAYGRLLGATGSADDYVAKVKEALALLQLPRDRSLQVTLTAILCHAYRLAGLLREALQANDAALAGVGEIAEADQLTLGFDIAIWLRGMRAQILAWLGRFDEARSLAEGLIGDDSGKVDALHRMIGHAVHIDSAWLGAAGSRDGGDAAQHAATMLALAEKAGNPYLLVYARGYGGLAQCVAAQWSPASAALKEAIALAHQKKAGLENEPRMLADLAMALAQAGDAEGAAKAAEEAIATARRRGARLPLIFALRSRRPPDAAAVEALLAESGLALRGS